MARIRYKEATGLEAKRGKPPKGEKPSKEDLQKLYIQDSKSIREVASLLGCTKDMAARALKDYGIERRTNAKRSSLQAYPIQKLENEVKAKGIRGLARELKVNPSTLSRFLRRKPIR